MDSAVPGDTHVSIFDIAHVDGDLANMCCTQTTRCAVSMARGSRIRNHNWWSRVRLPGNGDACSGAPGRYTQTWDDIWGNDGVPDSTNLCNDERTKEIREHRNQSAKFWSKVKCFVCLRSENLSIFLIADTDKTRLSCPCRRCELNWRQDKTVFSCLDPASSLQLFSFRYIGD